ncbi:MAG: O-sialoglycoprotein endopeptidase [Bacillota bacterium]|nr:O-sialoglycoprotein endopeptidase [Bacillota bacterium]
MKRSGYVLGIDTSNYKTSIAVTCGDSIIADFRKFLEVKQGERGLRQSEALFQHVKNLPELFEQLSAVAYSSRPRPVEGSYMPCFLAGENMARSMAALLGVPAFAFSHQEGHIEAVRRFSGIDETRDFLACHFSGGTCEVLKVKQNAEISNCAFDIEIIGGTKDISFGQVLDRAGVAMGMEFPCGEEMDKISLETASSANVLTPVKVSNAELNLSGIDTQIKNLMGTVANEQLIKEIFDELTDAICRMLIQASEKSGISEIIMAGGVSSSRYIRAEIEDKLKNLNIHFDDRNLASDNAVGIAFLGGRYSWD